MPVFTGLSAFPPTPADADGIVNTDSLGILVDRLAKAGVDSISILGSTGTYAYLDRDQRNRAAAAAIEAAGGRVPVVIGVGALRSNWSRDLAVFAERVGAAGLLLAPMSYTKLTDSEVTDHFRTVTAATGLPLCIYNNPGTTNFTFSADLIATLAQVPTIAGIKMPPRDDAAYSSEIAEVRASTSKTFRVGYSGDWCAAPALLAGADAWHSVVAGLLPEPALRLTHAAASGNLDEAARIDKAFSPLWTLFRAHGSLRLVYDIARLQHVDIGQPPLPLQGTNRAVATQLEAALHYLGAL